MYSSSKDYVKQDELVVLRAWSRLCSLYIAFSPHSGHTRSSKTCRRVLTLVTKPVTKMKPSPTPVFHPQPHSRLGDNPISRMMIAAPNVIGGQPNHSRFIVSLVLRLHLLRARLCLLSTTLFAYTILVIQISRIFNTYQPIKSVIKHFFLPISVVLSEEYWFETPQLH